MKIVKESLLEFHKANDPLSSLGLGPYKTMVDEMFKNFSRGNQDYTINGKEVIVHGYLDLSRSDVSWLPDILKVEENAWLLNCDKIKKLPRVFSVAGFLKLFDCTGVEHMPETLWVGESLHLDGCINLKELSEDTYVGTKIYVQVYQTELISFIRNSKFKNKLYIRK